MKLNKGLSRGGHHDMCPCENLIKVLISSAEEQAQGSPSAGQFAAFGPNNFAQVTATLLCCRNLPLFLLANTSPTLLFHLGHPQLKGAASGKFQAQCKPNQLTPVRQMGAVVCRVLKDSSFA